MAEILQDPVKLTMLIILFSISIPAAIFLSVSWVKACKEAEKRSMEDIDSSKEEEKC